MADPAAAAAAGADATPPAPGGAAEDQQTYNVEDNLEEQHFTIFSTSELEAIHGLRPHPDPAVEAASLASVAAPPPTVEPLLPASALQPDHPQHGISALQYVTVQMACSQHERKLPDGLRAGFFLGDGPGVGKGRQIASTILHNFNAGRTKALWVSGSADLLEDARRDLQDIGALEHPLLRLHNLGDMAKMGDSLEAQPGGDSGVVFTTYSTLIRGPGSPRRGKSPAPGENRPPPRPVTPSNLAGGEFGPGSRLEQVCDWLGGEDYLVVLDEAHRAKACQEAPPKQQPAAAAGMRAAACAAGCGAAGEDPSDGLAGEGETTGSEAEPKRLGSPRKPTTTKTARAVCTLQQRLPNCRFLYVSATGATEPDNLGYMERLGLWGQGTPFPQKYDFMKTLKTKGGTGADASMAAMELVATELKSRGCYISRTLSYEGVSFRMVPVETTEAFREMYDTAAALWQEVCEIVRADAPRHVKALFGAAALRFFRQLVTASKVDRVIQLAQEALDQGHCAVIGLQSTGEAADSRQREEQGGNDDDPVFDDFSEPAATVLPTFLSNHLARIVDPGVLAQLVARAKALRLPLNPLDRLVNALGGPQAVAEMTGRKVRMLPQACGGPGLVAADRAADLRCTPKQVNLIERAAFQAGEKRVAIISDAASTGVSLQADRSKANQALRVHITLELAWSADKTVQQLGRTHRANQRQPPQYVIVFSDIAGEGRFAGAVARRLAQMGALTQGDRRAANASDTFAAYNIYDKYASKALSLLRYAVLAGGLDTAIGTVAQHGAWARVDPPWLEQDMLAAAQQTAGPGAAAALPARSTTPWMELRRSVMVAFFEEARDEMDAANNLNPTKGSVFDQINRFFNRLLMMRFKMQTKVFDYFSVLLDAAILDAKRAGEWISGGIVRPGCDDVRLRAERVLAVLQERPTRLLHFTMDVGVPWEKALRLYEDEVDRLRDLGMQAPGLAGFYYHETKGWCLALPRDAKGMVVQRGPRGQQEVRAAYVRLVRPVQGFAGDERTDSFLGTHEKERDLEVVEEEWVEAFNRSRSQRRQPLYLLSGNVLPVLDIVRSVLKRQRVAGERTLKLVRVQDSASGERFIGAFVPPKVVNLMSEEIVRFTTDGPADEDDALAESVAEGAPATVGMLAAQPASAAAMARAQAAAPAAEAPVPVVAAVAATPAAAAPAAEPPVGPAAPQPAAPLRPPHADCPVCAEDGAAVRIWIHMDGCEHDVCSDCTLRWVRDRLERGDVERFPLRCMSHGEACPGRLAPGGRAIRRLSAARAVLEDEREPMLTAREVERYEGLCRLAAEAAQRADEEANQQAMVALGYKPCPSCGIMTVHYKGHACHHIRPGGGCPGCRQHWCYNCGRCSLARNAWVKPCDCPYFCDATCTCPTCPDCSPDSPCEHCEPEGAEDGRCPSCFPQA